MPIFFLSSPTLLNPVISACTFLVTDCHCIVRMLPGWLLLNQRCQPTDTHWQTTKAISDGGRVVDQEKFPCVSYLYSSRFLSLWKFPEFTASSRKMEFWGGEKDSPFRRWAVRWKIWWSCSGFGLRQLERTWSWVGRIWEELGGGKEKHAHNIL